MEQGWIRLHRKIIEWEWYKKPYMYRLFSYLILRANHEDGEWQGHKIKRGQCIIGRKTIHNDTGISEQSIRTCIKRLKSTNEITTKSTNQFTIITIINYEDYQQDKPKSTNKPTNNLTNNQPTTNQRSTTNKNNKNDKNDKNIYNIYSEQSSQINAKIELFKPLNPLTYKKWYSNKTQRAAVGRLIHTLGDKLEIAINTAIQANGIKYAPTITTPLQLEEKMSALRAFVVKERSQPNQVAKIK